MLSVIIPTLNAEATLAATLDSVVASGAAGTGLGLDVAVDIVVVDGGSTDATPRVALDHGARLVASGPGRGRQLARGAEAARGDWLLFLHADTHLSEGWAEAVSAFITNPANAQRAGFFRLAFDDTGSGASRVARLANWRAQAWGLPYGDQGLLLAKPFYQQVGGYRPDHDLMEDVNLVRRIGRRRLAALPVTATTSAARYRAAGWWARPLTNLLTLALYFAGIPPAWLKRVNG